MGQSLVYTQGFQAQICGNATQATAFGCRQCFISSPFYFFLCCKIASIKQGLFPQKYTVCTIHFNTILLSAYCPCNLIQQAGTHFTTHKGDCGPKPHSAPRPEYFFGQQVSQMNIQLHFRQKKGPLINGWFNLNINVQCIFARKTVVLYKPLLVYRYMKLMLCLVIGEESKV